MTQSMSEYPECWHHPGGDFRKHYNRSNCTDVRCPGPRSNCIVKVTPRTDIDVTELGLSASQGGNVEGEFSLCLGNSDNDLMDLFESCVETMRCGEQALFEIDRETLKLSDFSVALSENCEDQFIPLLEIFLISFERGKEIFKLSGQECHDIALGHRGIGTELYKSGNTYRAAHRYSRGLKILLLSKPIVDKELEKIVKDLKISLYLNLAMCQFKMKQFDKVKENCGRVLRLDWRNVKARYHRVKASVECEQWRAAREDLNKALSIQPRNQALLKLDETLRGLEGAQ